jgi:TonB family protein
MNFKNFFTFALFLLPFCLYGQDTLYFDSACKQVKSHELAKYYEVVIRDSVFTIGQEINYFDKSGKEIKSLESADSYSIVLHELGFPDRKIERKFTLNGKLLVEKQLIDVPNEKADKDDKKIITKIDGKYKEWYPNGILHYNIDYKKGAYDGELMSYWDNGKPKREETYLEGKSIGGKCFNIDGTTANYFPYEKMPEFPGGEKQLLNFISENLYYPIDAQKQGTQGKVIIRFVVEKTGEIAKVEVIRSVSAELDKEAIRVVKKLPQWKPGMLDGELVSVYYTLPILFRLN